MSSTIGYGSAIDWSIPVVVQKTLLVLAILALFALIVFWMFWTERKNRRDRKQIAKGLGFKPLDELDDLTYTKLIKFHQHTDSQELMVENVAEKVEGDTRWILFDLVDHSGDSNSTLVDGGIAAFSERLHLPRFSLFPRLAEKGRLNDIANRFLEMLIEKRTNRIHMGTNPHFEERYFLLGDDVPEITSFLDDYRLSRLSQSTYRHLEADGDCFTYSRFVFASQGKRDRRADLKRDLAETRLLLDLLSD
jgi:cbb3-type cytochrome oxidase subunit 3